MDLFSSLIGILHMLVAEGSFLPSCKLQPVGESLGLSAESRVVRVLLGGFFLVGSQCHPYLSKIFLPVLSADKFLTTQFLRLACTFFLTFLLVFIVILTIILPALHLSSLSFSFIQSYKQGSKCVLLAMG